MIAPEGHEKNLLPVVVDDPEMNIEDASRGITLEQLSQVKGWVPPRIESEATSLVAEEAEQRTPVAVHLSSRGFLLSMAAIAWESIRHPFSTSVVDLMTGRVLSRS